MTDTASAAIPSGGGPFVLVEDLDDPILADDDHHHLTRVRRVRDGDELILGDGAGRWRRARARGDRPEPVGPVAAVPRPVPGIGVGFALVKGAKPEVVVQKLTELGVDRIVPFVGRRSVVRWDDDKAAANHRRWLRVSREASMQSRQPWSTTVDPVVTFAAAAGQPGACLAERGGGPPDLSHSLVLVGPEGGWDPDELGAGIPTVALPGAVLRAETAAVVAGALLAALRAGVVSG